MRKLALVALTAAFACHGGAVDVQLAPPAASAGFQLGTGGWDVPKGTESQRCYFFRVPGSGGDPLWVNRIVAAQNPGSHHLNIFRVKTIVALDGEDGQLVDGGECWKSGNWADWPLVFNSQQSVEGKNVVDWSLPAGVAHRFTPGEKLMLQSHYVNAQTQSTPGRARALVNFDFAPPSSTAPVELGTVFATDQNIRICPGDTDRSFAATCRFARGQPVTVLAANGHFHSRGVKFTMTAVDGSNNPLGDPFYLSTQWSDPVWIHDLSVAVPQGGGVGYSCTYTMSPDACADPTDSCCATFGPHVDTQEHCNAFVYYYPKQSDATCF
jgi:hypothetical protein